MTKQEGIENVSRAAAMLFYVLENITLMKVAYFPNRYQTNCTSSKEVRYVKCLEQSGETPHIVMR